MSIKFNRMITLKNGEQCTIRTVRVQDAAPVLSLFLRTHEQTDFLLPYVDEITTTLQEEKEYLRKIRESEKEVKLIAKVGEKIVASVSVEPVGRREKVRHRCEFGLTVDRDFWSLGIGRALMECGIECARTIGYQQIELGVVDTNTKAINLYTSLGFTEFGHNPKALRSRYTGWQGEILMKLEVGEEEAKK